MHFPPGVGKARKTMSPAPSPEKNILGLLNQRRLEQGVQLFQKTFGPSNPPEPGFVLKCFEEIRNQAEFKDAYEFIHYVESWYPDHEEIKKAYFSSTKNYLSILLQKANILLQRSIEKKHDLAEKLAEVNDAMLREKFKEENQKTIKGLFETLMNDFQEINEIDPEKIAGLPGLFTCYKELGKSLQAEEVSLLLLKRQQSKDVQDHFQGEEYEQPGSGDEEGEGEASRKGFECAFEIEQLRTLFSQKRFDKVLEGLDELLEANPSLIPAFLLRARTYLELRQFEFAQRCIDQALEVSPRDPTTLQFLGDFQENKFRVLNAGGREFLKKALELGPVIGKSHFQNAANCITQALEIEPRNQDLLDLLYTCYMYLGEISKGFEVKKELALNFPTFRPTYDRENESAFCFLANFAFGENHPATSDFREIRDKFLLRSELGKRTVGLYYRISPRIVRSFRRQGIPPCLVRAVLSPIWFLAAMTKRPH